MVSEPSWVYRLSVWLIDKNKMFILHIGSVWFDESDQVDSGINKIFLQNTGNWLSIIAGMLLCQAHTSLGDLSIKF